MVLSDELSRWIARTFSALGHPIRVQIIMFLDHREQSVADLTSKIGVSQQVVSFHIRCLKKAGLVVPVPREERFTMYKLERAQFRSALDLIIALARERPPLPLGDIRLVATDRLTRPSR
jgi:DNA-binding transcriptional ArsR family regulator